MRKSSFQHRKIMKIEYDENKVPYLEVGGARLQLERDETTDPFFKKIALKELRETPENVEKGLSELRELLAAQSDLNVPLNDDTFLLKFLRPAKFYAQSAYEKMIRYYKFRRAHSDECEGLVPAKIQGLVESGLILLQGPRDQLGRRVIFIESGAKWNPSEVSMLDVFRGIQLGVEAAMAEPRTQVAGVVIIMDVLGFSLRHVMHFSPYLVKVITEWIQEAMPVRLKAVHLVNQPYIFNMVYALCKPFLQEKLRSRIHFHGGSREQLHAMIAREALRPRLDGTMSPEEAPGELLWQLLMHYEEMFECTWFGLIVQCVRELVTD